MVKWWGFSCCSRRHITTQEMMRYVKIIREMQVIIMTSVTTLLTYFQMKNAGGTSSRGWFSPYSLRDDTLNEIHFFMSINPSKVAMWNAKVEISGCITTSVNQ
jgi:hypothetical protein